MGGSPKPSLTFLILYVQSICHKITTESIILPPSQIV